MDQHRLRLVVGLGNPGEAYRTSRHNFGFMVVDHIAALFSILMQRNKFDAVFGRGIIEGVGVILIKPSAYMNRSGSPVRNTINYFKISSRDMVVIHDDIDLDFGRLKIKQKGGDGGHKGVRSIIDAIGGGDFIRLRIGIGRADPDISMTDHVLGTFSTQEKKNLNPILEKAGEAVVTILCRGAAEAMNRFNDKRVIVKS
jgi:PTH1 family peptidyl-tRNA hydrolase